MPKLLEYAPELYDLAQMEAIGIEIKRLPDEEPPTATLSLKDIEPLTVEELLSLSATVASTTRCLKATFPVFEAFADFHRDKTTPMFPLKNEASFGVASRTPGNILRWKAVPEATLQIIENNREFSMEALASVYAGLNEAANEEELFTLFMQDLVALVKNGALWLTKPA
jgi:hypothetical protein